MSKPGLVIAIDKPRQWSSFQVVNKLKWHIKHEFGLKKFKIGHAGTLDPLASGLLLVCVGAATKQIDVLQSGRKLYTGTMVLGATTPCYDLERPIDHYYPYSHITADKLQEACQRFVGPLEQVPPMFSAVKIGGQRAYVSARDGQPVAIEPKTVVIDSIKVTAFRSGDGSMLPPLNETDSQDAPSRNLYKDPLGVVPSALPQFDFSIACGKGTYIRSIARDLGEALGSGAFLSALRREQIGEYTLRDAIGIDDIERTITKDNPTYQVLTELQPNTTAQ